MPKAGDKVEAAQSSLDMKAKYKRKNPCDPPFEERGCDFDRVVQPHLLDKARYDTLRLCARHKAMIDDQIRSARRRA